MIRRWLDRLDAYGMDDPDAREGHPEDRCPVCDGAVVDHPTWKHRRAALVARALWP
jgi:murein DD-endopeptidase MepM/ murein hydrolase activator NlpD